MAAGVGVEYSGSKIGAVNVRGLGSQNTELTFDGNASGERVYHFRFPELRDARLIRLGYRPRRGEEASSAVRQLERARRHHQPRARSAFEYSRRQLTYRALFTSDIEELTLKERDGPKDRQMQYWRPNWEFRWLEPLTPDFGFALTVGHNDAIVRQHFSPPVWDFGTAAQAAADSQRAAQGLAPLNTVSVRNPAMTRVLRHDAPIKDTNDYATLRGDWRPSREFTLGYSTSWNYYTNQTADDVRYIWNMNQGGTGPSDPLYVDPTTTKGPLGRGALYYDAAKWRDHYKPTLSHIAEARWQKGNWTASARGTFSAGRHTFKDTEDGFFNSTTGVGFPQTGIGFGTANPIPLTLNFSNQHYFGPQAIEALDAAGRPIEWWKMANSRIGGARSQPSKTKEDIAAAKIFVKRDFNLRTPFSLQHTTASARPAACAVASAASSRAACARRFSCAGRATRPPAP